MDPVVDALTEEITHDQQNPEKLHTLGRSLDRVLRVELLQHSSMARWWIPRGNVGQGFERPDVLLNTIWKYQCMVDFRRERRHLLPEKRR